VSKKDEREHYGKIADIGCVVCILFGYGYSPCEIHHIRTGTGAGQKSHWSKAIGLCPTHHRLGGNGVAIHGGIKSFENAIGMSEIDLLKKQLELLGD
jgi:Recombination enhancement, RecA-dependent nuclease